MGRVRGIERASQRGERADPADFMLGLHLIIVRRRRVRGVEDPRGGHVGDCAAGAVGGRETGCRVARVGRRAGY